MDSRRAAARRALQTTVGFGLASLLHLTQLLNYVTTSVVYLLLLLSVGIAFIGVVARFIFNSSLSWGYEVGAYLFLGITFLGIVLGLHDRSHPGVEVLIRRTPSWAQRGARVIVHLVAAFIGGVFVVYGWRLVALVGGQTASSFELPIRYVYMVLPVSGVLYVLQGVTNILSDLRARPEDVETEHSVAGD